MVDYCQLLILIKHSPWVVFFHCVTGYIRLGYIDTLLIFKDINQQEQIGFSTTGWKIRLRERKVLIWREQLFCEERSRKVTRTEAVILHGESLHFAKQTLSEKHERTLMCSLGHWLKCFNLTFPGSSFERGTLRKHLFNDRLCRIEFCGGKNRERQVEKVSRHRKTENKKEQVCSNTLACIFCGLDLEAVIERYSTCFHSSHTHKVNGCGGILHVNVVLQILRRSKQKHACYHLRGQGRIWESRWCTL